MTKTVLFVPFNQNRPDDKGLFYTNPDKEKKKGGGSVSTYRPPVPDTGWRLPEASEFREFHRAKRLSIDIETKDPDLKKLGPGVRRPDSAIVGVAVGTEDGWRRYFPVGHETGSNLELERVKRYITRELEMYTGPVVGANLLYDMDFLSHHWGVNPYKNEWWDVQVAEPLIDENAFSYALERLGQHYLGEGKESSQMYEWLAAVFGGKAVRSEQAENIWRAPPELAGPYAESDADLPLRIIAHQLKKLEGEDLLRVWTVERKLSPMLLAMRQRGVRVDLSRAESVNAQLAARAEEFRSELSAHGISGPWDRLSIGEYCTEKGIPFPRSEDGGPSIRQQWLEGQTDEALCLVKEVRRLEKIGGTFVKNYILKHHVNGRLHCQFKQLRGDSGGAVSGRLSSSDPNLQNIPARDEELGPLTRSLWVPDEGEDWGAEDYSQVEFRLGVHYGEGPSADEVREQYWSDPTTDFHDAVAKMCKITRKHAKNINFGLVYGMGEPTMAANLGRPLEEVKPIFDQYHATLPFIKEVYQRAMRAAANRGYVRTLLGRRRRFDLWESAKWVDPERRAKNPKFFAPCSYDEAVERHTYVRRAMTNKALNSILQGGAADLMKMSMVKMWESGVCEVLGPPLITVHDELGWSVPRTDEAREAFQETVRIMEGVHKLTVPLLVDASLAESWGAAK